MAYSLAVPWNSNLFAASFGLENGSGGGEYDYQRQRLHVFTFGRYPRWIIDFEELVFISIRLRGLFPMRLGTIDNRTQRISDHNRSLTLEITTKAKMAMASVPLPTVSFR